nr:hypothetical protein [Acetobacter persici]
MVIIKIDDSYADGDFLLLRRHLSLLDLELVRLNAAIDVSGGLEVDALRDSSEYFIGHGFVAIQRYLTATRTGFGIGMNEAFGIPPMTSHGVSLVTAINLGANYWKHVEEWTEKINKSIDAELTGNALNTFNQLTAITPWREYTCSNLLAIILEGQRLELSLLLPKIEEWRNNVIVCRAS